VDYGPLVHPIGRDQVAKQVRDSMAEGARLLHGGPEVAKPSDDCGKSRGMGISWEHHGNIMGIP
jgi:acyl-CoA reductase-like NAD-dependent aldehyde dehydrogenase